MILVWLIRAFRGIADVFLNGLSLTIPDGLEDDIVAFVLTGADGFAALLDLYIVDSVLVVMLGVISFATVLGALRFVEKLIRRFMSLITGNDYTGR